ncbi:MAG: patatin-like phospholipase family protein [Tissierellia bacterium]|nr:patatin-like phospholipase family protein [Tissierellia bacterium]
MYAISFEGGGARGAYHIGAYKAILEAGLEVSTIVGTSVGSLNAALIAQGDMHIAEETWKDISYSKIFEMNDKVAYALLHDERNLKTITRDLSVVYDVLKKGGLDIDPFKKMLDKYVDEEKIRNSDIRLGIVTYDLSDRKPLELFIEDIPQGRLNEFLLASCYLPVFKMEPLSGKYYLDGGFYENIPFSILKNYEHDIIVVRTVAEKAPKEIQKSERTTVIRPYQNTFSIMDFTKENAELGLNAGYYDAKRVFEGKLGNYFYFDIFSETDALDFFIQSDEKMKELCDYFDLKLISHRQFLNECLEKLCELLDINKKSDFREILINAMEKRAKLMDIERFKFYKLEEMLGLLENSIGDNYEKNPIVNIIPALANTPLNRAGQLQKALDIVFKK